MKAWRPLRAVWPGRGRPGLRGCRRRLRRLRGAARTAGRLCGGQRLVAEYAGPQGPAGPRGAVAHRRCDRRALALACPNGAPPLLVKIAPDLTKRDREDIAAIARGGAVAGLIVANTTIDRPANLRSKLRSESGGLSGKPLFEPSTRLLAEMYRLTGGAVPLIGVGGIASGRDAYRKIRAGACLIQVYTAFVYQGPVLIQRIKDELAALLRADGYNEVEAAVGAEHR
jgi:dihydroorotate dehydrogenase